MGPCIVESACSAMVKGSSSSAQETYATLIPGTDKSLARVSSNAGVMTVTLAETLVSPSVGEIISNNGLSERCHDASEKLPKYCEFAPGSAMYAVAPWLYNNFAKFSWRWRISNALMGCASAQWLARPAQGSWLTEWDVKLISVKNRK